MTYSTDKLIGIAMQADGIVRYAAPRSILASGLAYHIAKTGETDESGKVLALFRETLKNAGATKGEVSTKAKQAKIAGENIAARFASEMASEWASEADLVEACFAVAYADGVKSVQRLIDYMQHGDADFTDRKKQAARDEKEAEKSAALADQVAAIGNMDLADLAMGQPVKPEPVTKPEPIKVQNFEPSESETKIGAAYLANLGDAELANLYAMIEREMDARKAEAEAETDTAKAVNG